MAIPHSQKSGRSGSSNWFNKKCSHSVHQKNNAFRSWKNNPTLASREKFVLARNCCNDVINKSKASFMQRTQNKLSSSGPAAFWSLAKSVINNFTQSSFPDMQNPDGYISSKPQEKANTFARHFAAASTVNDQNRQVPNYATPPNNNFMPPLSFTSRAVRQTLQNLKKNKSPGPD